MVKFGIAKLKTQQQCGWVTVAEINAPSVIKKNPEYTDTVSKGEWEILLPQGSQSKNRIQLSLVKQK